MWRRALTVFTIVLLASLPGLGEAVTFWGPEEFVRAKGQPQTLERQVSTTGYEPPFVLHVQHGDDSEQSVASNVSVWLNGERVVYLNKKVLNHPIEVNLSVPTILEVKVGGRSGGGASAWLAGKPQTKSIEIGPEGGTVEIGDLKLALLPNILPQPVTITADFKSATTLTVDERQETKTAHDLGRNLPACRREVMSPGTSPGPRRSRK